MGYKTDTGFALIKRSIGGSPLRGYIRKYAPSKPRVPKTVRPAQHIGIPALDAHLAEVLRSSEHLRAVVRGQMSGAPALFAATNQRIVILGNAAPSMLTIDVSLDMLAGIDAAPHGTSSSLTIFTTTDAYTIETLDRASVRHFVECVEVCRQTQHIDRDMG